MGSRKVSLVLHWKIFSYPFLFMLNNGNQFQAWKLLLFLKFELILWHCAQWFEQWEFQVGPAVGISAGDELWVARYILEVVWMKKIVINKAIIWWSTFFFVIILRLTLVWKSEDHRNCWSSSSIWPKTIQRHFFLVLFVVFTIHTIYICIVLGKKTMITIWLIFSLCKIIVLDLKEMTRRLVGQHHSIIIMSSG